ncbi:MULTISPECIES: transglutaminase-like domain-containing protein [unclassified Streptomyces]|uniref:transglutaminase-like domain-containing protein n=1 Tax=unclassified Streptomyces TaxID=2593676 RepID=UPI002E29EC19|nr:transglutaminase-like domain-containing protein [Streptomyces sp. NBC_00223]
MTDSVRERFGAAAREERPDLAELCLLIGAEADPALDGVPTDLAQIELDRLAGLLPYGLVTPAQWAQGLRRVLGTPEADESGPDGPAAGGSGAHAGFHGSPGDYQRLTSSLLQEVLRRRRGLPILLSVVWIEVARRAGAPVYGVALPGHFVVGFGDPEGEHVLVDPFAGGRVLTPEDTELLVTSTTGTALAPGMLTPADPLDIVQRILNNIRAWASPRPERRPVQLWALDLTLLLPRHPAKLRYERAQLLVQMGDFLGGAAELEEYAKVIAAFDPESAEPIRRQARAARALLN